MKEKDSYIIWHCSECHTLDCSCGEHEFNSKHVPHRGADIGTCSGNMQRFVKADKQLLTETRQRYTADYWSGQEENQ